MSERGILHAINPRDVKVGMEVGVMKRDGGLSAWFTGTVTDVVESKMRPGTFYVWSNGALIGKYNKFTEGLRYDQWFEIVRPDRAVTPHGVFDELDMPLLGEFYD